MLRKQKSALAKISVLQLLTCKPQNFYRDLHPSSLGHDVRLFIVFSKVN